MQKKFSTEDKRSILKEYEKGKPAIAFANEHNCDIRTIQKALDDARRERDATYARSELMKEALFNHQKRLEEEMRRIKTALEIPELKYVPLSWYEGDNSIFSPFKIMSEMRYGLGLAKNPGRPSSASTTVTDLLRQHLRIDPLWKLLVQNDKIYVDQMKHRAAFQRRVVNLLEQKTGYKMLFRATSGKPFLYSYTAGPTIYSFCLEVALEGRYEKELGKEIVTDAQTGAVRYRNFILVEDRVKEEVCRKHILNAFKDLLKSDELKLVKESHKNLVEICAKVEQAAEEILLLGYIPGSCSSCRKLGM